ncbi:hypothetical protein HU200_063063 [Digitaria exilis]|uniref:Leucine-rich repeat-containing N-terminal plant-type domain-containing protein n=1 Tax=Digitaria exilis TaxID=1010633 RepID=A0A835A2E2_9POAL|nr:hypothetical protein HU200_063063 [Digitaria exilis]
MVIRWDTTEASPRLEPGQLWRTANSLASWRPGARASPCIPAGARHAGHAYLPELDVPGQETCCRAAEDGFPQHVTPPFVTCKAYFAPAPHSHGVATRTRFPRLFPLLGSSLLTSPPRKLPTKIMAGPLPACCRFPLLIVLLLFLLLAGGACSQPTAGAGDRDTLLAVKKEWGNPPQLNSWDPAAAPDHCSWTGVTCAAGSGGPVTGLALSDQNLTGSVPASVCALRSLARLDLSYNNLTGAFPSAALYACAELRYLDLSYNQFSGPLPRDIDRISPETMEHLNLSSNGFSSELPPTVARLPALQSLLLDNNAFTGVYPATEISNLAGLKVLTLAKNTFAPAPIPTELAKLTNLTYLWMDEMSLTGQIPEELASLTELTLFSLAYNKLTGSIPAWVWHREKLRYLYLYDNGFSGDLTRNVTALSLIELDVSMNQLTGEIPEDFGNLKNVAYLFLYRNQLSGTIPASIGLLTRLRDIRQFNNRLSGELPTELGKHSPLNSFEVSNNNLSGPLRETLCANGKLLGIVVFNNNFSGDFPTKIWSSCPKLTWVMIQNNSFTGTLPAQISPNIKWIYMGNNMFSGSFPTSAPALEAFYAENNRLCGELPPDMSKLSNLTSCRKKKPSRRSFPSSLGVASPLPSITARKSCSSANPKFGTSNTNQYALEVIFHNRMRQYECLTDDPTRATAVYVPYYPALELHPHLCRSFNATARNGASEEFLRWLSSRPGQNPATIKGDFPAKIWSSLPKLISVIIQNNSFTGTLPAQISPNIKWIMMGNNMFSGSFPTSAPALERFYEENNRLGGELPSDMSKLSNLTVLSVPGNRITGSIPASIELLQKLQTLNLRGNQISGVIL